MTFEEWMSEVDGIVSEAALGMTTADLPDVDYRSMYDSGETPQQAAVFAVRNGADLDTDDETMPW